MKREIILLILAILFLGILRTFAQNEIKPIKIGDKVPEAKLKEMVNYQNPAKLSDFAGKALIIDIWATWCAGCLNAFPRIDSLQNKYKDKLNFLLVTSQPKKDIEAFFKKEIWQAFKFPSVVNDTLLRKYFPYAGLPHQIWIDKNGVVRSINNGSYLTEDWIAKLISGQDIQIREKSSVDDIRITSGADPLIVYDYQKYGLENLLSYGYVSKFQKDVQTRSSITTDKQTNTIRISYKNMPWLDLFWYAVIGRNVFENPVHEPTMIIRQDTKPYKSKGDVIDYSNIFCYDGIFKDVSEEDARKFMHVQLDAALNVKSYAEIRKMKVYILREYGTNHKYRQQKATDVNKETASVSEKVFTNKLKYFPIGINGTWKLRYPLLNEVQFDGKVYFEYDLSSGNPEQISKKLRDFGLEIVEAQRELKVLVITDK